MRLSDGESLNRKRLAIPASFAYDTERFAVCAELHPVDATRTHVHPPAAAWPHAAQLAAAFLLGAAAALLAVRVLQPPAGRPFDIVAAPPLDLNRAEPTDLLQLPGVGPTLAHRIVDVRDSRGGFRTADDLRAVPGVGPARLEKLRPWVRGDEPAPSVTVSKKVDGPVDPLDLNRASTEDLQRISGVGPKLAQRIIDERTKKPFVTVDDLRRVSGIGAKTLEKLRPYVRVEAKNGPRMAADQSRTD